VPDHGRTVDVGGSAGNDKARAGCRPCHGCGSGFGEWVAHPCRTKRTKAACSGSDARAAAAFRRPMCRGRAMQKLQLRALARHLLVLRRRGSAVRDEGVGGVQNRAAAQGQQPVLRMQAGPGLASLLLRPGAGATSGRSGAGDASHGPAAQGSDCCPSSWCLLKSVQPPPWSGAQGQGVAFRRHVLARCPSWSLNSAHIWRVRGS
jgi:hypothetical protein